MIQLNDDGERFLPDRMGGVVALEHLHRYLFALQFAKGLTVLDIASGEGYGTAMLAARAARATGVDIDARAVASASGKYTANNLEFKVGECANIPLADASVDLVVSFETLEHHDQHEQMMQELKRVMRSEGVLVMSSPDKLEYSDRPGWQNPFHVKELYAEEFETLLRANFRNVTVLRQRVLAGSLLVHDKNSAPLQFFRSGNGTSADERMPAAPYLLAVASDRKLPAIRGGVLEEDVSHLASSVVREANVRATSAIRAVALPGSAALRRRLDDDWYLKHNPDLVGAELDRYSHWVHNGSSEGRVPSGDLEALATELVSERFETTNRALFVAEERAAASQAALSESARREASLNMRHAETLEELLAQRQAGTERERQWAEQQAASGAEQRAERARMLQHLQERDKALQVELQALKTRFDESALAWASASTARERASNEQLKNLLQDAAARRDEAARESTRREDALRVKLDAAQQATRDALSRATSLAADAAHERDAMHQAHEASIKLMQARVRDIESSTSWRWTAPFRAVVALFRRSPRRVPPGETSSNPASSGKGTDHVDR